MTDPLAVQLKTFGGSLVARPGGPLNLSREGKMENKQIYSKTIKPKKGTPSTTVIVDKTQTEKPDRKELKSLAERIAGNPHFTRNWYYPQGWSFFPNEPDMRCVDYYFPYAEGGALLIDVMELDSDIKKYERKGETLRKIGHRYLILKKDMNENDALYELANSEGKK